RADIAKNAPGDEARYLHAGHVLARSSAQPQRGALVLERRLVERGVDEGAGEVPLLLHRAVDRRAVGVDVEDVHEHADLQRVALEVWILRASDEDDAAVCGRD